MDIAELEPLEQNHNIIYITEEESRIEWTHAATKELLKIFDEKSDMLDTGIISTQKKLWELCSKDMAKKGYFYTGAQCENKWKALKRSYRMKMERIHRFGSTKRPCPFESEVAEILSKRPTDSFHRSYSVKIDELKKQEDLFKINLNEPPGYTKEKKIKLETECLDIKEATFIHDEDGNLTEEPEDSNPTTYTVVQDDSPAINLLSSELADLKKILIKSNKMNMNVLRQTTDVHAKILDCLERAIDGQNESRRIEEKKVRQQGEILEQIRVQNELIERLVEKMGQ